MNNITKSLLESLVRTIKDTRIKLIFSILIETSCKVSELSNIKIIHISKKYIKINNRIVPISTALHSNLNSYINKQDKKQDYLFSTRQSPKISTKRIRQLIQSTTKIILKQKISPEDIRKISIKDKIKKLDINKVKKEVGLKRLDKRKYLTSKEISHLRDVIKNRIKNDRDNIIFELLLIGKKSKEIINLKVDDIIDLNINSDVIDKINKHIIKNKLSWGEYIFHTRQNTHLTKERIFQLIKQISKLSNIEVNPRILNNTAIALAINSKNPKSRLSALNLKTKSFHLHGGFTKNE